MTPSIRTFLLINLLLSVTLITSLAIIGNLFLAHKDIQSQLDIRLIRSAERMQAFFSDYPSTPHNFALIQRNLKLAAKTSGKHTTDDNNGAREATHNDLEFQIWSPQGNLLLHALYTPHLPLSNGKDGLSTFWSHGQSWRVNTIYDPHTKLTFMVAERANYRQQLENQLTQDSILIMLITYPFLGLLIWIIVGRGLNILKKVAEEVRHRDPSYLKT